MFAQVLCLVLIPVTLAGVCNFERDMCDWSNSRTDDFDWMTGSGKTNSSLEAKRWITGPNNDHTKRNSQGKYIFIETSPRNQGDIAILQSPTFQGTSDQCMSFYYHMYGAGIGTLNILIQPQHQNASVLWSLTGQQGNLWRRGVVYIPHETTKYRVLIEGIDGSNYTGDIAIDDTTFFECPCTLWPQKASPTLSSDCDFETGMCSWIDSRADDFDWSTISGRTTSSSTGPNTDHTMSNSTGKYIYIETSSPRKPGDKAILQSNTFNPVSGRCMTFYYHMYGTSIGTLSVLLQQQNQTASVVWSLSGFQGDSWVQGVVPIPEVATNYQILIEGIRGSDFTGDIAVDDINFIYTCSCTLSPQKATVSSALPEVLIVPSLETISVLGGDNLTVMCDPKDANPPVTSISWSHNGLVSNGSLFHIQNVTLADEGNLTCTADNRVGTNPGRVDNIIRVLKRFEEPTLVQLVPNSDFINVSAGENVTVNCVVKDGNPAETSITWSHNGHHRSGETFAIRNVTKSDEGRLTCIAYTGEGSSPGRADTFIRVLEECQGSLDVESWSGTWTGLQIAFVVSGSIALLVILILVATNIYMFRKLHQATGKKNMAGYNFKDAVKKSTPNKKPVNLKTVSGVLNPAYEVGKPIERRGKQESMDDYDEIEIREINENKSSEDVYVNAAVIRDTHS